MAEYWYVDSSVVLRAIKEGSPSVRAWIAQRIQNGDVLVSSIVMKVEVLRVLKNGGHDTTGAENLIRRFALISLDDELADEAVALREPCGGADSLHLASALRLGVADTIIATHDAQMARAAQQLGFIVVDPVTDDPRHQPVI